MVQNVSNQNNYGSISKIGATETGRVVYQLNDSNGKFVGKLSVSPKDTDTFERSYKTIMEEAPKLQKFAENTTEADLKKKKKRASWIIGIATGIGALIPVYLTRNLKAGWRQILPTLGGASVGLGVGILGVKKSLTPPGANKLNEASKALSSIDIQPLT